MAALSATDPTSFSNPDEVIVTNIDLDLEIDFAKHTLTGCVHLSLEKVVQSVDTVVSELEVVTVVHGFAIFLFHSLHKSL